MPRLPRCALFLVALLIPVLPAAAATVSFSSPPNPVLIDTEFSLQVNLSECTGCGNSYLRGVFYPSGTNYFGLTQNQLGEWVGTVADKTKYFQILKTDLISGTWSGQIKFRADSTASDYSGPGTYNFKIGRYTSASGSASWSAAIPVTLAIPTAVPPAPTPTSLPTPTEIPPPTPTLPPAPTPTPEPEFTPTPIPTSSPVYPTSTIYPTAVPTMPPIPSYRHFSLPKFPKFPAIPWPIRFFLRHI